MAVADDFIRFSCPAVEGGELDYIQQAIADGRTGATGGPFGKKVASLLTASHSAEDSLLTTSGSTALELTAMLLDLRPGDTVIVPSYTFVTSALAYVREGARILFADIEPVTLGIDAGHVAELMDDSVRAVVAVHYAGVACDLAGLQEVLADHPGVDLIEDNAHGLFGTYRGRLLGTFGRLSTLSFGEPKNFTCGEGGAVILNEARDIDRAHTLHDKGTNRRAFTVGEVDKYTWVDRGSAFGLSDVLAAYLYGQLEARDAIMKKRRDVYERYAELLAPHAAERGFTLPTIPADRESGYHLFHVLVADRATRDATIGALRAAGISAPFHFVPLHSSPGGRRFAAAPAECPVAEDVAGRLIRLPLHNGITDEQIRRVADTFLSVIP